MYQLILVLLLLVVGILASPQIFDGDEWKPLSSPSGATDGSRPPVPTSDSWSKKDTTIYVGISSFRDKRCADTLKSLFSNADNPERISVGVIEHIHTENDKRMKCLDDYCRMMGGAQNCRYVNQITVMDVSFLDARGPGMSRVMQENLLGEEEFCMQVDAHSKFAKGWDTLAMGEWGKTNNEYAIISTVPPPFNALEGAGPGAELNHVCQATFTQYGMVRNLSPRKVKNVDAPVLAPLWSAAFSFSKCHAVKKVPYDPNLHYIFDGEEFSRMARFWTKGYDVYSPSAVVVTHDADTSHLGQDDKGNSIKATSWSENGQTREYRRVMFDEALKRLKTLLGQQQPQMEGGSSTNPNPNLEAVSALTRYGLGAKRTLDQYIEFSGVNPKSGGVLGERCKALVWVPHSLAAGRGNGLVDPALDEGDVWGLAPEPERAGGTSIPLTTSSNTGEVSFFSAGTHQGQGATTPTLVKAAPAAASASDGGVGQGQLWGLFRPVDWMMDSLVARIEAKRPGAGVRMAKLMMLGLPLMAVVLVAGMLALVSERETDGHGHMLQQQHRPMRSPAEKMV